MIMIALPDDTLKLLIQQALNEDLGKAGDITTDSLIAPDARTKARLRARAAGVICGCDPARLAFHFIDAGIKIKFHKKDGDTVNEGDCIADIEGPTAAILRAERVALNFMTHLSGIATLTRHYVDAVKGTQAKIMCTRKTIPNLRALQKYAVRTGGGKNHRFGLYDAVLIKDNHLTASASIADAVAKAREGTSGRVKIEVEVDSLAQLEAALKTPVDVIMLDNFSIADMKAAVALTGGRVKLEASGGISLANVRAVAETGIDMISIGALTHSAPALDLALDF